MLRRLMLFVAVLCLLTTILPSHGTALGSDTAARYAVIDLGQWTPNAINDAGVVVGNAEDEYVRSRPVRWADGSLSLLLPSNFAGQALDVNAAGQIVGSTFPPDTESSALLWTKDEMKTLPMAYANGINTSGVAVGTSYVWDEKCYAEYSCRVTRPVRWADGTISTFGTLSATACDTEALDINDQGVVIGEIDVIVSNDNYSDCVEYGRIESHAVVWRNGVAVDLGAGATASALNNTGVIVGLTGNGHPVRWVDGVPNLLIGFGANGGTPFGINDSGQIVGTAYDVLYGFRAVLWENDTVIDLNTLLGSSLWQLTEARAINNKGQIVGVGMVGGQVHGFMLVPRPQVPVVVVPGILGSYLDRATGGNVWPFEPPYFPLSLNPRQPQTSIIATDVIRFVYNPLINSLKQAGYQEYRQPALGCDRSQQAQLFVFPYDWRLSNAENAQRLDSYMECVRSFSPNGKVDIVAHSMGGLLARRFILDHPNVVRKLVTIGTPWVGAPQALYAFETGELRELYDPIIRENTAIQAMIRFWPGAHELLPAPTYFSLGGRPFEEDGWDFDADGIENSVYTTHNQLVSMLDRRYRPAIPGANNTSFYNTQRQTDWRGDSRGVQYYHIVGVQKGARTIGRVLTRYLADCTYKDRQISCNVKQGFDMITTRGDSTVPLLSAARIGDGLNLNAPGARLIVLTEKNKEKVDHIGLLSNPDAQAAMVAALLAPTPSATRVQAEDEPQPELQNLPAESPVVSLKVRGSSTITLTDQLGNSTSSISDTFESELPSAVIFGRGSTQTTALLDTGAAYTATLQLGSEPLSVFLTTGTTTQTTTAVRWVDAALPSNTRVQLQLSAAEAPVLCYDADGDGTFETIVPPTIALNGQAAGDTVLPEIAISLEQSEGATWARVTASDADSGVKRVLLSLDGETFAPYSAPLVIDSRQASQLIAIVDDNAGNRNVVYFQTSNYAVLLPLVIR